LQELAAEIIIKDNNDTVSDTLPQEISSSGKVITAPAEKFYGKKADGKPFATRNGAQTQLVRVSAEQGIPIERLIVKAVEGGFGIVENPDVSASSVVTSTFTLPTAQTTIDKNEVVTDEQYKNFIDNGIVSQQRIEIIAEKIKNNEQLTQRELAMFTAETDKVNKELRRLKVLEQTASETTIQQTITIEELAQQQEAAAIGVGPSKLAREYIDRILSSKTEAEASRIGAEASEKLKPAELEYLRDAYKKVGYAIEANDFTPDQNQVNHTHEGSIGNH
jgi:hypothetical protein